MLRKFFIVLSVCLFSVTIVCAQGEISYNMGKAYEALENEDYAEAEKYFTLEIYENTNNGYAWTLLSILKYDADNYEASLNAANNAIKYLSKGDEKYIAISYSVMANCNLEFGEYKKALKNINQAIELGTSRPEDLVIKANILYEMGKSTEAILQLGEYINSEPNNFYGYYSQKFDYPPEQIISHSFYKTNPSYFFRFYREKMLPLGFSPNITHLKLVQWEREGKLLGIVTQNIDGLHQKAGSSKVFELHEVYCGITAKDAVNFTVPNLLRTIRIFHVVNAAVS